MTTHWFKPSPVLKAGISTEYSSDRITSGAASSNYTEEVLLVNHGLPATQGQLLVCTLTLYKDQSYFSLSTQEDISNLLM